MLAIYDLVSEIPFARLGSWLWEKAVQAVGEALQSPQVGP